MPFTFPAKWNYGSKNCEKNVDPAIQVHKAANDTFILRQNICLNSNAPFLYVLMGRDKAVLIDTGATASSLAFPLASTVDDLIHTYLMNHETSSSLPLLVIHTNGRPNHVSADEQFRSRSNTEVVSPGRHSVVEFFGFDDWPNGLAEISIGDRMIEVLPVPGHSTDDIAIFDHCHRTLFSGDTFYSGRLVIRDWNVYRESIGRLLRFSRSRSVEHILGAHIDMTSVPGLEFSPGASYHPDEHVLQLAMADLELLDEELSRMGSTPCRRVSDNFIIHPFSN